MHDIINRLEVFGHKMRGISDVYANEVGDMVAELRGHIAAKEETDAAQAALDAQAPVADAATDQGADASTDASTDSGADAETNAGATDGDDADDDSGDDDEADDTEVEAPTRRLHRKKVK